MAMDSNRRSIDSVTSVPQSSESLISDAIVSPRVGESVEERLASVAPTNGTVNPHLNPSLIIDATTTSPVPSSPPPPTHQRQLAWQIAPNVFLSFRYAWMGVVYAFSTQRNLRIHTIIGTIALGLSTFLQLPRLEIAVIGLTIALVLAMELLNTAIESVVDLLVKQSYHELAKIAKDCAAGAVLVSALASVLVAGLLLLPPLYQKIVGWALPTLLGI